MTSQQSADSKTEQIRPHLLGYFLLLMAFVVALGALEGTSDVEQSQPADVVEVEGYDRVGRGRDRSIRYYYLVETTSDAGRVQATLSSSNRFDRDDVVPVIVDEQRSTLRFGVDGERPLLYPWSLIILLVAGLTCVFAEDTVSRWWSRRKGTRAAISSLIDNPSGRRFWLVVGATVIGGVAPIGLRTLTSGPAVSASVLDANILGANDGVVLLVELPDGQQQEVWSPLLAYDRDDDSVVVFPEASPPVVRHGLAGDRNWVWAALGFVLGVVAISPLPRWCRTSIARRRMHPALRSPRI